MWKRLTAAVLVVFAAVVVGAAAGGSAPAAASGCVRVAGQYQSIVLANGAYVYRTVPYRDAVGSSCHDINLSNIRDGLGNRCMYVRVYRPNDTPHYPYPYLLKACSSGTGTAQFAVVLSPPDVWKGMVFQLEYLPVGGINDWGGFFAFDVVT